MKIFRVAFIAMACMAPGAVSGADMAHYEGLSGRGLADAVRADFTPVHVPTDIPIANVVPADWPDGWWPAAWPATGTRISLLMPAVWTGNPIYDLYNIVLGDDAFEAQRMTAAPGNIEKVMYTGNDWQIGETTIYPGLTTDVWQPAADRRGDLARRFMYLALMYPQESWNDTGAMVMADGYWPLLQPAWADIFGEWSIGDPIDRRELDENSEIAAAQGNENPFIIYPELFSYLWGEKAGEVYIPGEKADRQPLRGHYSRTADGSIDLYSPYVGAGAEWMFDGKPVEGESVDLRNVDDGIHTVSYRRSGESGKLKITVSR